MKILFYCSLPFSLAHGGQAIQIERTMAALAEIGVTVEPWRWWDAKQTGDLIHYVGVMPVEQIEFARQKKVKVVIANILTAQGSQNRWQRGLRRVFRWGVENFAPRAMAHAFGWESYRRADGLIANTLWEKYLLEYKFSADPAKIHLITNGVEAAFFDAPATPRGQWLVCTATITERKRVLELARAAVRARTPLWVIGQAYSNQDPYAAAFLELAKKEPQLIRYEGGVSDRHELAKIYRSARGFVLLSTMETLSLSAQEAVTCECPLLLSDLPWARCSFPEAQFTPVAGSEEQTAKDLRAFYDQAPQLAPLPKPPTWRAVAEDLRQVYARVLAQ
ncbi:MAG TPA: glycosyltransferase family 4 protein [Verrucomicrobiae bacterium]